jgi:CheY-like chemotaxis protein
MPASILRCEECGNTQQKALDGEQFGLLLAEGSTPVECEKCGRSTNWKLVLPPRNQPVSHVESRPRKLLIIDDDRSTLQVLQMMLRAKNYVVEAANSADEAVQKLQTTDYDAIISDIKMPEFDGPSLFRFLAVYLPDYTRKVVFLTGDHSEKTLAFLKECGCPYTFKPIDLKQLEASIKRVS